MNAVVITTINEPLNVLDIVKKAHGEWLVIIVGDLKTPHDKCEKICKAVRGVYLSPEKQMTLGFTHASSIPWNCYDRKNLGYLFALREGADIIYSTDDDNYPIDDGWDEQVKLGKQTVEVVTSPSGWWNCLSLSDVKATPRGYPYWLIRDTPKYSFKKEVVDVAVQSGLWIGDPDVDAMTRIVLDPKVSSYQDREAALGKGTMCPYDSQNTFISREMLPAHMVWSGEGTSHPRFDDIYAGYVGQIIAQHHGKTIKFGKPLVIQNRNYHDLLKDLTLEMGGMGVMRVFFDVMNKLELKSQSVSENLREIVYKVCNTIPQIPKGLITQVDTWCYDLEKINK